MFKKNAGKAVLCVLAAGPFVVKDSINTGAIGLTTLLGIGATAWNWGGKALKMLDTFAAKGMGYQGAYWFLINLKDHAVELYEWVKRKMNKATFRKPEEFKKIFDEGCKSVQGQEAAKKKLRNIGLAICHAKNKVEMKKEKIKKAETKKEKIKGTPVILCTGTSGCGKSMMAEVLANAISTKPPIVVSSGDIDINSKVPVVEQLFKGQYSLGGYDYGYGRGMGYGVSKGKSPLDQIKEGGHIVIIFNEYDKMHSKPPKDKKDENYLDPLDELMRAFADEGSAWVCGQKIDASNVTFILTSNEKLEVSEANKKSVSEDVSAAESKKISDIDEKSKDNPNFANSASLKDLKNEIAVKESVGSEVTGSSENKASSLENLGDQNKENICVVPLAKVADNVETIKKDKKEDLSRTNVKRDQSFFNRIFKVEFEHLKPEDLEKIAEGQGEDMISYWKEYANVDLDLSKIYKPIARKASTMPEHGRAIRSIMSDLTGLLSDTFEEYLETSKDINNKPEMVVISYDEKTGNFSIETPASGDSAKIK